LSMSLFAFRLVTVKMLPFDNKSEFQVVIDMPEGTTLEQTSAITRDIGVFLSTVEEVTDFQIYVGTASPYNFNGLVRHYFLRTAPHESDVQVNLLPSRLRNAQSHDIARRVREPIQQIARTYGASVKIAEVPPGPPVLQTLVAEIYGPDYNRQIELAQQVQEIFDRTEGVVDVDSYIEADQVTYQLLVDRQKAALSGVSAAQIATTVDLGLKGTKLGLLHDPSEKEDVDIIIRLPRAERSSIRDLEDLKVAGSEGQLISLGELVEVKERIHDKNIYHKNLLPVVYVTGDVAGQEESPVYAILKLSDAISQIEVPEGYEIAQYTATQ